MPTAPGRAEHEATPFSEANAASSTPLLGCWYCLIKLFQSAILMFHSLNVRNQ